MAIMSIKYTKLIAILFVMIITLKSLEYFIKYHEDVEKDDELERVKISIHYEALCPDSRFFVVYQLLPIYKRLKNNIDLDFIPYGKAKTIETAGKIEFECQHDITECFANKIHACAISVLKNPERLINYISCLLKQYLSPPEEAGELCAKEQNINFTPILDCANSNHGSILLKHYGERTNALRPRVKFIPTIQFNGSQTIVSQALILKDFKKAFCSMLRVKPKLCLNS
ncbi:unnamed protein product [Diabrotica balteata]|uniref:GILT-like protein 1 n=1 Tax=Diabrotica balteata TaxID=107213 RepID=A0A9N9X802_DIABA|nr:unnamed protein product [Diabrotica balteata]